MQNKLLLPLLFLTICYAQMEPILLNVEHPEKYSIKHPESISSNSISETKNRKWSLWVYPTFNPDGLGITGVKAKFTFKIK